jgi:segregation and condensation protein B
MRLTRLATRRGIVDNEEMRQTATAADAAVPAERAGETGPQTAVDAPSTAEAVRQSEPIEPGEDARTVAAEERASAEALEGGSGEAALAEDAVAGRALDANAGAVLSAEGNEPLVASAEVKAIIEALIFASPEPLSKKAIAKLLDSEPKEDVDAALTALKADYDRPGGLQLVEVAGGYQIVTRPDLHEWVRRLFHERSTQKLSAQALESLAVIAYRQPVTAAEITEIRGVNTSGVLNTLLERHLVKIVGRKAVVGRPFMYATTREFLIRFGLNDISDLPRVQEMVDALGLEAPILVEQNLGEDQLPLDEPDEDFGLVAADDEAEPGSAPGDRPPSADGSAG